MHKNIKDGRKMSKKKKARFNRFEIAAASRMMRDNAKEIDKPRRNLHPTFKAMPIHSGNECAKCFSLIESGECIRYNEDGELVHAIHKAKEEVKYDICQECWLTLPCECDR